MTTSEPFSFTSRCVRCGRLEFQPQFTREELVESIEDGLELDAHCRTCDATYAVTEDERERLAALLGTRRRD